MDELTELARKIIAQFGAEELATVLERLGAHGVAGDLKNLIFAADGPKPRIVLRDAINNVIEIVAAEYCRRVVRAVTADAYPGLDRKWQHVGTWPGRAKGLSPDGTRPSPVIV